MRPPTTTLFTTPARRRLIAKCLAAAAFVCASASYGQFGQAPAANGRPASNVQQTSAPVNPESLSCTELKGELRTAGELNILSGPRGGWGDTFYGPGVPRCQFWQMPQFTYVRARDGLCGVGYICIEKYSLD